MSASVLVMFALRERRMGEVIFFGGGQWTVDRVCGVLLFCCFFGMGVFQEFFLIFDFLSVFIRE